MKTVEGKLTELMMTRFFWSGKLESQNQLVKVRVTVKKQAELSYDSISKAQVVIKF